MPGLTLLLLSRKGEKDGERGRIAFSLADICCTNLGSVCICQCGLKKLLQTCNWEKGMDMVSLCHCILHPVHSLWCVLGAHWEPWLWNAAPHFVQWKGKDWLSKSTVWEGGGLKGLSVIPPVLLQPLLAGLCSPPLQCGQVQHLTGLCSCPVQMWAERING